MTVRTSMLAIRNVAVACVLAAPLLPGKAMADNDADAWNCSLCSPASGWELDLSAGPFGVFGDDLFHFGDFTGIDDTGLYGSGDLFARYRGENASFFNVEGYRLGLESSSIFAEGGQQGLFVVRASYQGIPRRLYDSTATPYRSSGNERLNLLQGWVHAPTTAGMTELDDDLQKVEIQRDWNVWQLGVAYTPGSRWLFDVNYRRQERDGNAVSSGAVYFDAAMFAAPVDNTTDELELVAAYSADTWQLSASYWGAFFDNGLSSLTWDNPFLAVTAGADAGQLARAPDNDSHQLRLAGSILLPARTTLVGHLSIGRMEQDDSLLPYTINSQISTAALPSNTANAKVDTTSFSLRATSSVNRKFTLEGEVRFNERDNRTPERQFDYVITDAVNAADVARNIAYDYERTEFRLRGEYRLLSRTRLNAGYDYESFSRSGQERDDTDTDLFWVQLRTRAIPLLDLDLKLYTEDRDGSVYTPVTGLPAPQNPLMRKYNMADRERDGFKATASVFASDRLNLGLNAELNKDDYSESLIGLLESEYQRYGVDGSYVASSGMSVYASLSMEAIDSTQANSQSFSAPDWVGTTEDSFVTGSIGLTYPGIFDDWDLGAHFTFTESDGETHNDTSGLDSRFPSFQSNLNQFRLELDYRYSDALSMEFKYLYEKFDSDDWGIENVDPATVPNLLALGADPWDYDAHVFYVGVRYLLDTRGQAGKRLHD